MSAEREQLQRDHGPLFDRLSQLLFDADPVGVNFETNTDEYEPEVETILPRLKDARSPEDVQSIVHEEFCRWFGADTAGSREQFVLVSQQIWLEWCKFKAASS